MKRLGNVLEAGKYNSMTFVGYQQVSAYGMDFKRLYRKAKDSLRELSDGFENYLDSHALVYKKQSYNNSELAQKISRKLALKNTFSPWNQYEIERCNYFPILRESAKTSLGITEDDSYTKLKQSVKHETFEKLITKSIEKHKTLETNNYYRNFRRNLSENINYPEHHIRGKERGVVYQNWHEGNTTKLRKWDQSYYFTEIITCIKRQKPIKRMLAYHEEPQSKNVSMNNYGYGLSQYIKPGITKKNTEDIKINEKILLKEHIDCDFLVKRSNLGFSHKRSLSKKRMHTQVLTKTSLQRSPLKKVVKQANSYNNSISIEQYDPLKRHYQSTNPLTRLLYDKYINTLNLSNNEYIK